MSCVVFVPVVWSEAVRLERVCIFNWTCLLQIRTLSPGRQWKRSWWEPQMLHPRKRTQFTGIITLSRLHLDCHYFPLCSIQSVFIVWPVSSLPSATCLFTGTLSLLLLYHYCFQLLQFSFYLLYSSQHPVIIWHNPNSANTATCYSETCGFCRKNSLDCNVWWESFLTIRFWGSHNPISIIILKSI